MSSVIPPYYVFGKVLSPTDAKHRFAYPVNELHHLCSNPEDSRTNPIDFKVIDGHGNHYLLRLSLRRKGFLKPEITGEWMRFVRANNLKTYDRVIFKKHPVGNSNGIIFTVAVRRAIVVFGTVFGYSQLLE